MAPQIPLTVPRERMKTCKRSAGKFQGTVRPPEVVRGGRGVLGGGGGSKGGCVYGYLQSWESCQSGKHPQLLQSQLLPYSLHDLQNNVCTSPSGLSNLHRAWADGERGAGGGGGGGRSRGRGGVKLGGGSVWLAKHRKISS